MDSTFLKSVGVEPGMYWARARTVRVLRRTSASAPNSPAFEDDYVECCWTADGLSHVGVLRLDVTPPKVAPVWRFLTRYKQVEHFLLISSEPFRLRKLRRTWAGNYTVTSAEVAKLLEGEVAKAQRRPRVRSKPSVKPPEPPAAVAEEPPAEGQPQLPFEEAAKSEQTADVLPELPERVDEPPAPTEEQAKVLEELAKEEQALSSTTNGILDAAKQALHARVNQAASKFEKQPAKPLEPAAEVVKKAQPTAETNKEIAKSPLPDAAQERLKGK